MQKGAVGNINNSSSNIIFHKKPFLRGAFLESCVNHRFHRLLITKSALWLLHPNFISDLTALFKILPEGLLRKGDPLKVPQKVNLPAFGGFQPILLTQSLNLKASFAFFIFIIVLKRISIYIKRRPPHIHNYLFCSVNLKTRHFTDWLHTYRDTLYIDVFFKRNQRSRFLLRLFILSTTLETNITSPAV